MLSLPERYGPWALVAGASEGIGAAFSRALAEAGFSLLLIARRKEPLEALAATLPLAAGREVRTRALDLGAPEAEAALREWCEAHEVGLVVYNAALSILAPFVETPLARKLELIDVNVRGPLLVADLYGRAMAARGRGALVLLSSLTAFWGSAWLATYGATKAFNLSLGEALSVELGAHGVDVVACCAGATATPGFLRAAAGRRAPRAMSPEAVAAETLARLGRRGALIPGSMNRLAALVLGLLPRRWAIRVMAGETHKLLPGAPRR